jgi:hypothetical protein
MGGTDSGSYPLTGFYSSGVEPSGSFHNTHISLGNDDRYPMVSRLRGQQSSFGCVTENKKF